MQQNRARGFFRGLIAISLLTGMVSLTDQAQAASGNGPYYATPSWDQKLPGATRFVVLTDWNSEAVLDRETGLMWEQSPSTTRLPWLAARFDCANRTIGGRKGWRLPSLHELGSLIDPAAKFPAPALPPGHPFTNVQPSEYWSATTNADDGRLAWDVNFSDGRVFTSGVKRGPGPFWCVRGGNSPDVY